MPDMRKLWTQCNLYGVLRRDKKMLEEEMAKIRLVILEEMDRVMEDRIETPNYIIEKTIQKHRTVDQESAVEMMRHLGLNDFIDVREEVTLDSLECARMGDRITEAQYEECMTVREVEALNVTEK